MILLAPFLNDKSMHLNILKLMVSLISILNSLFFHYEISPLAFRSKMLGVWGGVDLLSPRLSLNK